MAVQIGWKTHHVVYSPALQREVLSHGQTTAEPFLETLMENVMADNGLYRSLSREARKALAASLELFTDETKLGELTNFVTRFLKRETANFVTFNHSIVDQTAWERGAAVKVIDDDQGTSTCEAKLFALVRNFTAHMTTYALMGEAFVEFHPGLQEDLWAWHRASTALLFGAPKWLPSPGISAAYAGRQRVQQLMAVLEASFAAIEDGNERSVPIDFRDLDDVSAVIQARMRAARQQLPGNSTNNSIDTVTVTKRAKLNSAVLWAATADAPLLVFWMLYHIYSDPKLLQAVRDEISPFARASRLSQKETGLPFAEPPRLELDMQSLLQDCPLLRAVYIEITRLYVHAVATRTVTGNDGLTLTDPENEQKKFRFRPGDRLTVSAGAHHMDPSFFRDPETFSADRFLEDKEGNEKKSVTWRTVLPFGIDKDVLGKTTREFTERQVLATTAAILAMWTVEPVSGSWPVAVKRCLGSGTYYPAKDIKVRLQQRV